jgi:hypothetical protein
LRKTEKKPGVLNSLPPLINVDSSSGEVALMNMGFVARSQLQGNHGNCALVVRLTAMINVDTEKSREASMPLSHP